MKEARIKQIADIVFFESSTNPMIAKIIPIIVEILERNLYFLIPVSED